MPTPILLGSCNLKPSGRQARSKNCPGVSPIVAHGVRADSDPVASSGTNDLRPHYSFEQNVKPPVVPQKVCPDNFFGMSGGLHAASSMNRRRQQWKISWTCRKKYSRSCNFFLFWFLISLIFDVIRIIDYLFHKKGILRTRPIAE